MHPVCAYRQIYRTTTGHVISAIILLFGILPALSEILSYLVFYVFIRSFQFLVCQKDPASIPYRVVGFQLAFLVCRQFVLEMFRCDFIGFQLHIQRKTGSVQRQAFVHLHHPFDRILNINDDTFISLISGSPDAQKIGLPPVDKTMPDIVF